MPSQQTNNPLALLVSFDLENSSALAYIQTRAYVFAQEVVDSLLSKLRDTWNRYLAQGIREGWTVAEFTQKVEEVFRGSVRGEWYRARRIARTESIGAANMGTAAAYKQADVPYKTWITMRDGRVRDTHRPMDMVSVPTSDKFELPSGALMDAPGDPAGGAREVVHCRCTIIGVWAAPSVANNRFASFRLK